ncbi:MAG: XRE family transcriptional regulator [Desulfurellales bacterium]|nr:MAG: XRE family transcriptional regulator [Desulfurellales bacterium]
MREQAVKLGVLLRELREAAGLTQRDVAARAGVSQQAIAKWERGIASPYLYDLARVAKLYGTTPQGFFKKLLDVCG